MQPKFSKIIVLIIIFIVVLTSCTFFQQDNDDEIYQLQEQVNALATQNASLQDQLLSSENESLEAPLPPEENSPNQDPIVTPFPETLPVDPVPAGVPIIYDGWSMIVSKELAISRSGESWGIEVYVKNLGDTDRVFRYVNAGVTPRDDLGNVYEYLNDSACGPGRCEAYRHEVKNIEIKAEDSQSISSFSLHCNACDYNRGLDWWPGPIPLQASQITISFEDFGPFDGIEVVIDL